MNKPEIFILEYTTYDEDKQCSAISINDAISALEDFDKLKCNELASIIKSRIDDLVEKEKDTDNFQLQVT